MDKKKLQIEQLDQRIAKLLILKEIDIPTIGWIKSIRIALGISMKQLAKKLNISSQSILESEQREKEGAISIRVLKNIANALEMDFVYGFVPKDGSIELLIERKAHKLATEIVMRTSQTMKLEEQENSKERLIKAIDERTILIKQKMPKALWD